jgi:hypothetical protein
MSSVEWTIKGPHFANCNCDYGCPCQFNALPSDGTCRAVVAWQIDEGRYGDLQLDGLLVVNTYGWPGAIHEGGGEMQSIIDERADEAQREALIAILQGEGAAPGSIMLKIYRTMCETVHEPLFKPIELAIDIGGRSARLAVPGVVETAVEPIRNPVTGAEHQAQIGLPMGKEFQHAEVASGSTKASGAVALEFEKSHAHLVDNEFGTAGVRG